LPAAEAAGQVRAVVAARLSPTAGLANGGAGGAGGSDGQGVGGGVYNLGTFTSDPFTVIAANHASTSNDDIFP